jgi:hypothetical protein
MQGVLSTLDLEMSIAAALLAAWCRLGLQMKLVLVRVNSRGPESACLFPDRRIGRSSTFGNDFYSADAIDIVHGNFPPYDATSEQNDPLRNLRRPCGSSFPLWSTIGTSTKSYQRLAAFRVQRERPGKKRARTCLCRPSCRLAGNAPQLKRNSPASGHDVRYANICQRRQTSFEAGW